MGLDISLYQVDDFEKMIVYYDERAQKFSEWQEGRDHYIWGDFAEMFPSYSGESRISFQHATFPEHFFNVGHFNLPYGGGIFSVLRSKNTGLEYVFEPPKDTTRFRPDWVNCLRRCQKLEEDKEVILEKAEMECSREDRVVYSEALEIVSDTVKYVLGQKAQDLHYVYWG